MRTCEPESANRSWSHREDTGEATDAGDAAQGKESGKKYPGFSFFLPSNLLLVSFIG